MKARLRFKSTVDRSAGNRVDSGDGATSEFGNCRSSQAGFLTIVADGLSAESAVSGLKALVVTAGDKAA